MKLNYTETARGFKLIKFEDGNCEPCTIQESSAYREESLIWLGAEDVVVKAMTDKGWQAVDFEGLFGGSYIGNQRMHLTQSQVKAMLPILEYFVEHGALPDRVE